jgi:hypothetical protein
MITNRFDVSRLKGKLGQMRDWLLSKNLPFKLIFIIMGIASTVWFLIRVIPKPSRATYPCMQVAAPFMSGFVTYLLAVGGLTAISRRFNKKINVRFGAAVLLLTGVMIAMAVTPSSNMQTATWYFSAHNNNPEVIGKMYRDGILKLTGEKNAKKAWESVFRLFNSNKHNQKRGYQAGEKIFIKINQGQSRWVLVQKDKDNGFYLPKTLEASEQRRTTNFVPTEQGPYVVL